MKKFTLKIITLLFLLCLIFANSNVSTAEDEPLNTVINLENHWKHPPGDQGYFGFCHAFTAVGMTEAAYYRRFGRHIDFSEKWVLSQIFASITSTNTSPGVNSMIELLKKSGSLANALDVGHGGDAYVDLELIKEAGLCKEEVYPYWEKTSEEEVELLKKLSNYKQFYAHWSSLPARELDVMATHPMINMHGGHVAKQKAILSNGRQELQEKYNKLFSVDSESYRLCKQSADIFKHVLETMTIDYEACDLASPESTKCKDAVDTHMRQGKPAGISTSNHSVFENHAAIISGYVSGLHPALKLEAFDPNGIYLLRNTWGHLSPFIILEAGAPMVSLYDLDFKSVSLSGSLENVDLVYFVDIP
ncbi:hypothetical protein ACFL6Y_04915 [Elusimicrobiota bacterium]